MAKIIYWAGLHILIVFTKCSPVSKWSGLISGCGIAVGIGFRINVLAKPALNCLIKKELKVKKMQKKPTFCSDFFFLKEKTLNLLQISTNLFLSLQIDNTFFLSPETQALNHFSIPNFQLHFYRLLHLHCAADRIYKCRCSCCDIACMKKIGLMSL